jgi:hypothetical protein
MGLPMDALRVVVTGDVPGMTRDAARDAVRRMGGQPLSTVTGSIDLLVVGPGAGASKLAKAAGYGLRQLPAAQFAELAENPDRWDGQPLGEPVVPQESLPDEADAMPRKPATVSQHPASICAWTHEGAWRVVMTCRCGHRAEGSRLTEAESLHRAHRVDAGDLEPDADDRE